MDHSWIEMYGPWAVLIGGILEGETFFIAAGYAISQGYMDPVSTLVLATAGGSIGDTSWYLLGRWHGPTLIRAMPFLSRLRARATLLMRRWGRAAAFLMRFAYGLRIILPASIGASRFPAALFVPFNLLGSLAFASLYLVLGYFFGEALEELLVLTRGAQWWVLLGIGGLGLIIWSIREWRIFHAEQNEVD